MGSNRNVTNNIRVILKDLRKGKGYTQEFVAEKLNITRAAYTRYETGVAVPTVESLMVLAELYKCSLDYLTGRYSEALNVNMK